jgi:hypothetical protein
VPNTNKMQWPFPAKDEDPWYERFEQMVTGQDTSGYASREDRHLTFSGGGTVSFNATTGEVDWSSDIDVLSPIAGFKITIASPTSSLFLEDGEVLYVNLTRSPTRNLSVSPAVASTAPNTDNAYTLCVRNGGAIYWANGAKIADGESKSLFYGTVAGTTTIEIPHIAARVSHGSDTPLVAGGIAFNPLDYDKPGFSRVITFRAVAANGEVGITSLVRLFNVTDNEEVASLSFTTTEQTKDEVVLVEGGGAGEIDQSEKIYEVFIQLQDPPGGPTETVELYDAEIQVVSTAI